MLFLVVVFLLLVTESLPSPPLNDIIVFDRDIIGEGDAFRILDLRISCQTNSDILGATAVTRTVLTVLTLPKVDIVPISMLAPASTIAPIILFLQFFSFSLKLR
mmetsp:Transcript_44845/g.45458  ORF Transcript_44845/g.45458 Transcript_44845/m.45458 type:complete len:104 (-) Transcript_44845:90-401(-)